MNFQLRYDRRRKDKTKGKDGDEAAGKDDAEGAIEAFVRAGFAVDAARTAMRGAKGDVSRALDDLCAALGPSREEALAEAMEAFADTGADSASEDDIREVLRNAQYDELSELPRDLYKQRGYNPASGTASMAVEIAGIVALGAAKQYAADFYVSFKDAPLYPFELPRLSFSHPTLDTERSIAVSVAMMRHAASLVGQPMIDDIIEWLQGSGPLEAIEEARERAMAPRRAREEESYRHEGDSSTKRRHSGSTNADSKKSARRNSSVDANSQPKPRRRERKSKRRQRRRHRRLPKRRRRNSPRQS